jgi:hypothetical protein
MDNITAITKKVKNIVTALYMVTEYIKDNETIRHELRTLSISILKDANMLRTSVDYKLTASNVHEKLFLLIDLLHICRDMRFISIMNATIIDREIGLLQAQLRSAGVTIEHPLTQNFSLPHELFSEQKESLNTAHPGNNNAGIAMDHTQVKNHTHSSPFFHSKSKTVSDIHNTNHSNVLYVSNRAKHDDRKTKIIELIRNQKNDPNNPNIKYPMAMIKDITHAFPDVSEKTIQRELADLVASGVLKKIGEKRWSKYTLA